MEGKEILFPPEHKEERAKVDCRIIIIIIIYGNIAVNSDMDIVHELQYPSIFCKYSEWTDCYNEGFIWCQRYIVTVSRPLCVHENISESVTI